MPLTPTAGQTALVWRDPPVVDALSYSRISSGLANHHFHLTD